ncbi:interferon gamma receptor 1 [Pyxicephalus adspersus]|uniref:interferon gamma receptor 1 n=1 Tax=Pyxicephalus adspersus TaxID=30357 RepID=UPI003B5B25D2
MAQVVFYHLTWVLLLLCVTSGRPSEAEEVPEPFNLAVNSYNLNTTLRWDYKKMQTTPYFCVEILNKVEMKWMVIETCENISHHFCDLSYEITDPLKYYKVGVKALVGSKTSNVTNIEFSLSSEGRGIIGPPYLEINIEEKIIYVDIYHPKVPMIDEKKTISDYGELTYIVYYGNDTKKATDCDTVICTVEFPVLDKINTYCFSAQGISNDLPGITMEKSKETCISFSEGLPKQTIGIIIGVVIGFLAIVAISCFIITRWTKARAFMPQSLSSLVRNIASYVYMPAQQIPHYDNVSVSPNDSPNDIKDFVEKVKIDTDFSKNSVTKENSDLGYRSSLSENEQKTDERGDDLSNSSNYFHADSSTSGINSEDLSKSVKDEKVTEHTPEPPKDVKPITNSFGYDKPHFPKEII